MLALSLIGSGCGCGAFWNVAAQANKQANSAKRREAALTPANQWWEIMAEGLRKIHTNSVSVVPFRSVHPARIALCGPPESMECMDWKEVKNKKIKGETKNVQWKIRWRKALRITYHTHTHTHRVTRQLSNTIYIALIPDKETSRRSKNKQVAIPILSLKISYLLLRMGPAGEWGGKVGIWDTRSIKR